MLSPGSSTEARFVAVSGMLVVALLLVSSTVLFAGQSSSSRSLTIGYSQGADLVEGGVVESTSPRADVTLVRNPVAPFIGTAILAEKLKVYEHRPTKEEILRDPEGIENWHGKGMTGEGDYMVIQSERGPWYLLHVHKMEKQWSTTGIKISFTWEELDLE